LKGKLTDDQNRRVTDAKVRFENMRTKEVYEVEADSITGNYVAVMNFTSDVVMTVEREGAAFTSRYFSTEDTLLTGVTKMNVEVKEAKAGEAYRLHDIHFDFERFELNVASKNILTAFATYLKANPKVKVAIHGHTDSDGSDALNMTLSQNRAKAVNDYLISKGIAVARLSHQGFGATKPIALNTTPEGKAKNRRTEFVITGK
jgi:outer membrane protein OmpA-like peptidoglycan-associated protein